MRRYSWILYSIEEPAQEDETPLKYSVNGHWTVREPSQAYMIAEFVTIGAIPQFPFHKLGLYDTLPLSTALTLGELPFSAMLPVCLITIRSLAQIRSNILLPGGVSGRVESQ